MKVLEYTIKGTAPLLMRAPTMVDGLHPLKKQRDLITKKKAKDKTDADELELRRLDFMASLYIDEDGLYLPGEMILAAVRDAAKETKSGAAVLRYAQVIENRFRLVAGAPKTAADLWEQRSKWADVRSVRQAGRGRVMRCRPIFRQWKTKFQLAIDEEKINQDDVTRFVSEAGQFRGIGDYRPLYGRFEIASGK